jgi:hypothetical protein
MKIYFINSRRENCGVYQYGLRIWDALKESKLDISYYEIETIEEFYKLDLNSVDILFFNWIEGGAEGPFGWYQHPTVMDIKNNYGHIKTVTIMHTPDFWTAAFDFIIDQDPAKDGFTRPLYNYDLSKPKPQNDIPHIGSFGFAGERKGFDDLVKMVNDQFEEAQVNIHITRAHYGDADGVGQQADIDRMQAVPLKPGIKLNITTDFLTNEEVLDFCRNNDLMVFAYRHGRDISGVPDYVISADTPLAVTNVGMFNPVYSPEIDMALHTLPEILEFNKTTNYVGKLREEWSRENLRSTFENLATIVYNTVGDKTYSQVCQDLFALTLIGRNGYFLDLGAGWDHSGVNSNSLLLEEYGWNGICVEGDELSSIRRKTAAKRAKIMNVYIPQTDLRDILRDNNAPKVIDYVSVDIDPMSMIGLNNFPFDEYDFKVMTFEHDTYRNGPEQKELSYALLTEKGYVRLCNDVNVPEAQGVGLYFEDWWINPKYFSEEFIANNQFDKCLGPYIIENIKK